MRFESLIFIAGLPATKKACLYSFEIWILTSRLCRVWRFQRDGISNSAYFLFNYFIFYQLLRLVIRKEKKKKRSRIEFVWIFGSATRYTPHVTAFTSSLSGFVSAIDTRRTEIQIDSGRNNWKKYFGQFGDSAVVRTQKSDR